MRSPSPLLRLLHWGPLVTLGIINWVSWATLYSASFLWGPISRAESHQALSIILFVALGVLTTFHFLSAILLGPGYLPKGWTPENPLHRGLLQTCRLCGGYKAPRSHHCRRCGRCVLKMDHHCPWINNCVGHRNQGHFLAFLAFSVAGCGESVVLLGLGLYRSLSLGPGPPLSLWSLLLSLLALGLSVGVVLAVGALLGLQLRALLRNQTGIEDWILEKAAYRRKMAAGESPQHEGPYTKEFVHPYHLGAWRNFREVVSLSCIPRSDGIASWPLRPGCGPTDLTEEQLLQKAEKRARSRVYLIRSPYNGALCPLLSHGLRISLNLPLTDEPRIAIASGDRIRVSRWKKYWLYGDKVQLDPLAPRLKGWFPRGCALERPACSSMTLGEEEEGEGEEEEGESHPILEKKIL